MGDSHLLDEDWLALQRQFWERLSAATAAEGDRPTGPVAPADPWQGVLDQWWQQLQPGTPLLVRELLEKMLTQGRQLFQVAELFARAGSGEAEAFDWDGAIQQTFSDLRGIIAGITGSMNPVPEAMLSEQVVENSEAYLKRLFAFPGFGPGYRSRAQQREMVQRMLAYQRAHRAYDRLFVGLGQAAVDRLRQRVAELETRGERIGTAQALYRLWSGTCEEVYAEQVMSEEYVRLYGELINSQMAVKQQMRLMMDDTLQAFGMPTSRGFRNLEQRAHQDRQAIKALQASLAAGGRADSDESAGPSSRGGGKNASRRRGS